MLGSETSIAAGLRVRTAESRCAVPVPILILKAPRFSYAISATPAKRPAAPHGNRRICAKGRWPLPTVDSGALAASQPEEEIFDKIDRTVELLGPSQSYTGFQVARACLNPMMDYLGRGMDATAYTLPTFMRFDAKMLNAVAKLIGQGEEWPTDGTAHLGRDRGS